MSVNEAGGVDQGVNANIDADILHHRDGVTHVIGVDFGTLSGRAVDHRVEAADWIVWQMTGVDVRNACTVGYTAVRQDGRYPDEEYLSALDPGFGSFVRDKVERPIAELGDRVGSLTAEAAEWTGLPEGIAVCDFGQGGNDVMRRLRHLRREAVTS